MIFLRNDFYHAISNIKVLFSKDYVADLSQYYGSKDGRYHGTGEWSYRPVRTVSYFLDAYLYKFNPFGYHLTNLLLHTGAVVFLYLGLSLLLASPTAVFLTAALFSLHPLQLEVVAGLSYRTDSLAALFTFGSFYFYLKHYATNNTNRFILLSLLFYALGIFSKESVIVYPALVFLHAILVSRLKPGEAFGRAVGFALIAAIYLGLYFYVFKNAFIGHVPFSQAHWLQRLETTGIIFLHYLSWIFNPLSVHLLPGLYTPSIDSLASVPYIPVGVCFVVLLLILMKDEENRIITLFFLAWFLAAFLPVSNIIALANPCAHRFMYFPSVGMYALLAMGLVKIFSAAQIKKILPNAAGIAAFLLAGLLMVQTMPMASYWKSNLSIATQWVKYYPGFYKGYEILALEYFKRRECDQVITYSDKALALSKTQDPRMFYIKGSCLGPDDPGKEGQLLKAVELQPNFMSAHFELGKYYFQHKQFDLAQLSFETAYALAPQFNTSIYLIKTYIARGQMNTAQRFYSDLYEQTTNKREKRFLENFYLENFSLFSPAP